MRAAAGVLKVLGRLNEWERVTVRQRCIEERSELESSEQEKSLCDQRLGQVQEILAADLSADSLLDLPRHIAVRHYMESQAVEAQTHQLAVEHCQEALQNSMEDLYRLDRRNKAINRRLKANVERETQVEERNTYHRIDELWLTRHRND